MTGASPLLSLDGGQVSTLFLVLLRCTGFVIAAPIFGHRSVPNVVKAGLAGIVAMSLVKVTAIAPSPEPLLLAAPFELIVGLALGFIVGLGFSAVEIVGRLLSLQLGLSLANVFDPVQHEASTPLDPFFALLAALLFLGFNLHLAALGALGRSFEALPLGGGWPGNLGLYVANIAGVAIELGTRLALPLALVLLLAELAVALVARAIPQVNVFFLGLPLKILIGFAVLAAALPSLATGAASLERYFVGAAGGPR